MKSTNRFNKSIFKRLLVASFFLTAALVLQSCEVKSPILPSWDVELTVPVVDRNFDLQSVINKDSSVLRSYNDPDRLGLLYYRDLSEIEPIVVGDKLKMSPIGVSSAFQVGTISANAPAPVSINIPVSDFVPGAQGGQPFIFPPVSNQSISKTLDPIDAFEEAVFSAGNFRMSFFNNNGVQITINSITMRNAATSAVIPQLSSSDPLIIPSGQTGVKNLPLAGARVPKNLRIDIVISSPGSGGAVITLPQNAGTSIDVSFQNFELSEITAVLPQQPPIAFDSTFALDDSSSFSEIVIDNGTLTFSISNTLDVEVNATFTFANLRRPDNTPFSTNVVLGRRGTPSSTANIFINDLEDWKIVGGGGGALTNQLAFSVSATAQASTDPRNLKTTDQLSVDVTMSELTLKSINGKFKPTPLNFAATNIPIKLGTFSGFNAGQLVFDKFGISLNIASTPSVQLGFSGTITGKNSSTTRVVTLPYTVLDGTDNLITLSETELRDFINTFAQSPPDSIVLNYSAILNPNYTVGGISSTDSLYGESDVEVPIKLGIGAGVFTDTSEVNISQANQDELNNLISASVSMDITNGLPIGIEVVSNFYDEFGNFLFKFPPNRAPNPSTLAVPGGLVDVNGKVTTPRNNVFTLELTQEEFSKLTRAKKLISTVNISTSGANALPVQFRTSDKIRLNGYGVVKYRVKP